MAKMTKIARHESDPHAHPKMFFLQKAPLWANVNACGNCHHDRTKNVRSGDRRKRLHTKIVGILVPPGHTPQRTQFNTYTGQCGARNILNPNYFAPSPFKYENS